ncbi:MAG: LysM peptidoglycan-binding domain-containing protein [Chloroflexota bacterium]
MKERLPKLSPHCISLIILIVSLMPASYVLARTDAPSATFDSPPSGSVLGQHTVQPGENLYCIARAYGVDPVAIATTNSIVNPNLIYPGTVLDIPDVSKTLPAGRVCPRQFGDETPPSGCRWNHVVASGQNLYRISLHYGVSMYAIAQANNITNMNLIYAGDTLCIP